MTNKKNPKISVVIPCYNGEKYLLSALESLQKQTYKPYEVIVVNDGSTDGTANLLKALEETYGKENWLKKFKVLHNEKNKGIAATINKGIQAMEGDVYCWLSADDIWLPEKLETQVEYHNQYPNAILYTDWKFIGHQGEDLQPMCLPRVNDDQFRMNVMRGCNVNFSTIFVPKKILDAIGLFKEGYEFGEDYDWLIRAAIVKKVRFVHILKILVGYRNHPDMLTKKILGKEVEMNERIRRENGL